MVNEVSNMYKLAISALERGDKNDALDAITFLANACRNLDNEAWCYVGEYGPAYVGDVFAGAWWYCNDYHGGQGCELYALQCLIGRLYAPGPCQTGPEEDTSEAWVYGAHERGDA